MKPSPKQRKHDRDQKNINQILYKTYIYIALLIFPEWKPTAKEIILFLEGKSKTVKGLLDLKSTALGLPQRLTMWVASAKMNMSPDYYHLLRLNELIASRPAEKVHL
jgi:hypothetical protein